MAYRAEFRHVGLTLSAVALHLQLLFVIAAMAATFLLVPRGFSAGEIEIQSDHMSWNTTKGTYQLNLLARIPIKNPNFLNVRPRLHPCPFTLPHHSSDCAAFVSANRLQAGLNTHVQALLVCCMMS